MNKSMEDQLVDYGRHLQTVVEDMDLPAGIELMAQSTADPVDVGLGVRLGWRRFPGWVYAGAAAAIVLLLVGGSVWLSSLGEETQPAITQPTTPAPPTSVPPPSTVPPTTLAPPTTSVRETPIVAGPFETFTGFGCVYDLDIAADGAVWAACGSSGLRRFDGVEWSFPFEDSPQGIFDVAFTGDGTLVAAGRSEDGNGFLSYYTGGEWHSLSVPNVFAIETHPDGTVWAAAGETGETPLMRLDQDGWNQVPGTFGLGLAISPDGAVWSIHPSGGGLFRWDGTQTKIAEGAEFVWSAPDGTIWMTGAAEAFGDWTVARYKDHEWTDVPELRSARILDMAFPDDGTVWAVASDFADYAGAYQYDGTTWTRYTTEDGLPTISLSAVAAAPDGSVWFGTSGGGIVRFTPPA